MPPVPRGGAARSEAVGLDDTDRSDARTAGGRRQEAAREGPEAAGEPAPHGTATDGKATGESGPGYEVRAIPPDVVARLRT